MVKALCSLLVAVCLLVQVPLARPAQASPLGAPIDPQLLARMQVEPSRQLPVIVAMDHAAGPLAGANVQLAQQALGLLRLNGTGRVALPLIDSAAGLANAAGITALSLLPGVAYIAEDAEVAAHTSGSDGLSVYPQAVDADRVLASGNNGAGVGVAVLDSGIADSADLAGRVVGRVNFADRLGGSNDPGGHGSHVAGTIAGNGAASAGQFLGIAPGASVVDVRVLDGQGRGLASTVILGVQWALDHRQQYNIRVLNLSLGAPPRVSYRTDPLAAAVEMAWLRGVVVVAASGNAAGVVDSPGADPLVVTVGATDDNATAPIGDDVLGWFSGYGAAKPDVVAPGRKIVSLRSPGSTLDQLMPDHVVAAGNGALYTRLTGTSMSTAVVSGVVALLLQHQPTLKPDQVKAILMGTARPFGSQAAGPAAGAGLVSAYGAVFSGSRGLANRGFRPADLAASSLYAAVYGQPLHWKNPLLGGVLWSLLTWTTLDWSNLAWDNLAWDNLAWDNLAWDNLAWDNLAWDNLAWDNLAWDNLAWDNIAWDSSRLD